MIKTPTSASKATLLALLLSAGLAGCGESDDHGHPHDGAAEDATHAHDEGAHSHDGEAAHAHDEPETEAFYGDEADAPAPATGETTAEPMTDHHEPMDDAASSSEHGHDHEDGADDHHH